MVNHPIAIPFTVLHDLEQEVTHFLDIYSDIELPTYVRIAAINLVQELQTARLKAADEPFTLATFDIDSTPLLELWQQNTLQSVSIPNYTKNSIKSKPNIITAKFWLIPLTTLLIVLLSMKVIAALGL
jgi:hypothetical protein